MLTPYDRKQQARERARLTAKRELDEAAFGAELAPSCDWDAALARIVPAEGRVFSPAQLDGVGPAPAERYKPAHGGYPRSGS